MKQTLNDEIRSMKQSDNALDQSVALNRIVMAMLEAKKKQDIFLKIILLVSILINLSIVGVFVWYERNMVTTVETTETIVEQDTGEGSGNNVYQSGENASYNQVLTEGVVDGETND